jgi:uncharacterized membrane protein
MLSQQRLNRPFGFCALGLFLAAAVVSVTLSLIILVDHDLRDTGIMTLKVRAEVNYLLASLTEFQVRAAGFPISTLNVERDNPFAIPPPIPTDVAAAPTAIGAVASGVQSVANSEVSAIQTAAAEVGSIQLERISLGIGSICLVSQNSTLNCKPLPLDLSSLLPSAVVTILGDSLQTLQKIEDTLVSRILGTLRHSIVSGVVLVILCGALLLVLRGWTRSWKVITVTALCALCLIIPFLVSTITAFLVQKFITQSVNEHLSQFMTSQSGNVGYYCMADLICVVVMIASGISVLIL